MTDRLKKKTNNLLELVNKYKTQCDRVYKNFLCVSFDLEFFKNPVETQTCFVCILLEALNCELLDSRTRTEH